MKRRKPDLLMLLAVVVGLGVLVTGWAQGTLGKNEPAPVAKATEMYQR